MPIDMKQFHSVFFEESQEHLDEMEQVLLKLNTDAPDQEQLNCIFRAAHSIKGGSGIFGFDALASVTHIMESLLDNIRQGKMAINHPMVDLFLNSIDVLKSILNSYSSDSEIDWNNVQRVCIQLEAVTEKSAVTKQQINQGFGFFSDEDALEVEDGYGFFGDPIIIHKNQSYGFFADE